MQGTLANRLVAIKVIQQELDARAAAAMLKAATQQQARQSAIGDGSALANAAPSELPLSPEQVRGGPWRGMLEPHTWRRVVLHCQEPLSPLSV